MQNPNSHSVLKSLGWGPAMEQQVSVEEKSRYLIGRISAHHRTHFSVAFPASDHPSNSSSESTPFGSTSGFLEQLIPYPLFSSVIESFGPVAVGDWVLFQQEDFRPFRILERTTLLSRKAAGREAKVQVIAANVDTLFVVTSCNFDFNLSRIERYLAIASESGCEPIIVLTKADLAEDHRKYAAEITRLDSSLVVESLDARDSNQTEALSYWCRPGKTVALVGSSGVGKSTLANTLMGDQDSFQQLSTGGIRESDSKGRHTTTSRSLHLLTGGGILIDNPGIRELQLLDCEDGIQDVFDDVLGFLDQCQFRNCNHQTDTGCAALAAVESGQLDPRRLKNYLKLLAEQRRNTESIADRHRRDKKLGKLYKSVQSHNRKNKFSK